jgi:hypothetical protein
MDPFFILVVIATCSYDHHMQLSVLVISDWQCSSDSRLHQTETKITDELVYPLMMESEIHEKLIK